jgi:hypothetical protein
LNSFRNPPAAFAAPFAASAALISFAIIFLLILNGFLSLPVADTQTGFFYCRAISP